MPMIINCDCGETRWNVTPTGKLECPKCKTVPTIEPKINLQLWAVIYVRPRTSGALRLEDTNH